MRIAGEELIRPSQEALHEVERASLVGRRLLTNPQGGRADGVRPIARNEPT
jgi:hypothetical protein